MVKLTITAASALLLATSVSAYNIYNTNIVNCREGPSTETQRVRTYTMGMDIEVKCQSKGQKLYGTDIWDMTQDNCYILDYYVYTGYSEIFKPLCGDGSSSSSSSNSTSSADGNGNDNSDSSSDASDGAEQSDDAQSSSGNAQDESNDIASSALDSVSEPESKGGNSGEDAGSSSGASRISASLLASVLTAGATAGYALSLL
ncbi:hypothetical protein IW140_005298 [Coemansia sp. RSA 1813]|nr:hypothetical protein EV178_005761 [Coemansia sp. RSA 1646]KAJ1768799.1 hypothetical protein LPJ74_004599 [Coemansia sp. RSA 1843]KAJ2086360.1 hypothetical protein IW138_005731 [Coemansia sp. RSA 986]KAJ2212285.1 hypothetical protein EV179_004755 [Coemansia sp. RSA 487]KAJ2565609.1 hypothetical protein IW140_005298 [Coemansia sp. RSA 1813]